MTVKIAKGIWDIYYHLLISIHHMDSVQIYSLQYYILSVGFITLKPKLYPPKFTSS